MRCVWKGCLLVEEAKEGDDQERLNDDNYEGL